MKFIKISQVELLRIKELYEGVMSHACHGLFFREGSVLGKDIVNAALKDKTSYFQNVETLLKARGWCDEAKFEEGAVYIKGSIEAGTKSDLPTCHRLRGIIREVYEGYYGGKVHCVETECESQGKPQCMFKTERLL